MNHLNLKITRLSATIPPVLMMSTLLTFMLPVYAATQEIHSSTSYLIGPGPLMTDTGTVTGGTKMLTKPPQRMPGNDRDYIEFYQYPLAPHLYLRPDLQQIGRPGAVSTDRHTYVGGISAALDF